MDSISLTNLLDLLIVHEDFSILSLASSGDLEFRIILIILSKLSILTDNPIKICALSSALFKSYFVLLIITSSLNLRKLSKKSFSVHVFGFLSTIAKELNQKELSIAVYL